jgi:hypothetical protein
VGEVSMPGKMMCDKLYREGRRAAGFRGASCYEILNWVRKLDLDPSMVSIPIQQN